jgi:hypothetical protein
VEELVEDAEVKKGNKRKLFRFKRDYTHGSSLELGKE